MFIDIDGIILDREVLDRQRILIKNVILYEIKEKLAQYGFIEKNNSFTSDELQMEIKISFKEKV